MKVPNDKGSWILREDDRTNDLMQYLLGLYAEIMNDLGVVSDAIQMCEADEAFVKRFNLLARVDAIRAKRKG